jgi:hypothetical protein
MQTGSPSSIQTNETFSGPFSIAEKELYIEKRIGEEQDRINTDAAEAAIHSGNRASEHTTRTRCMEYKKPDIVARAYTLDSQWPNRTEFLSGRDAIKEFLRHKWAKEQDYHLMRKERWSSKRQSRQFREHVRSRWLSCFLTSTHQEQ